MILTACDIRAVGPGVWTGWKGSLLRALYYATEPLLSGGHSQSPSPTASKQPAASWPKSSTLAARRCRSLYGPPLRSLLAARRARTAVRACPHDPPSR
ncbi:hypothetical protein N8D56_03980 [Devosia sp. A8/3-2]|nr:hypothetical protein N8D56_03980 [Devosia sp. A8/3-2]